MQQKKAAHTSGFLTYFLCGLVHDGVPTVDILGFAELDGAESVVELGAVGTGLFAEDIALASLGVIEALDGADDGGGTAGTGLLEGGKFLDVDGTTLDLHAHILGELHKALVSDGGQDGSALRGDVGTVLDAEEVGSASLVDIFLLFGIQVELAGVLATVASLDVGFEGSGIVTTDFVDTGAEGGTAVVLAGDDVGVGLEAALEVGSHGGDEDEEEVFVGRFHTHGDAGTDEQGTEVEAGAGAVGRNETLVHLDDLFAHLDEFLGRQLGHHNAAAGALEALGVGFGAEDADLAVFAAVGFQALEGFLTVVEAGGSHVHFDVLGTGNFDFAPLAITEVAAHVVVGFYVTEGEVLPIYIHDVQFFILFIVLILIRQR